VSDNSQQSTSLRNQRLYYLVLNSSGYLSTFLFGMLFLVMGADQRLQQVALVFFFVFIALGLAINITNKLLILFRLSILVSLTAFTLQILLTGGIHSPSMPQLMIIPILALFYKPKFDRYLFLVLTILVGGLIAYLNEHNQWIVQGIPDTYLNLYTICTYAYVSVVIFTFIVLFRTFVTRTNRKLGRSMEELKRTTQQLIESEKMASLGQLMAGIAHEINNPINYVKGSSEELSKYVKMLSEIDELRREHQLDLERSLGQEDFGKHYLDKLEKEEAFKKEIGYDDEVYDLLHELTETIKVGTIKTSDIVNSLRMYSRQKSGLTEAIDINRSLKTSIKILKHLTPHDKMMIMDLDDDLPRANGNDGRLSQVFLNVIANAIQAAGENGNVWVSSRLSDTKNKIEVLVRDNGSGIPLDIQAKVFDPFFTTKDVGKGTGLGLSISKSIVEEHEGSITFYSDEKGTTFQIQLPLP
jgi:signal transduction histidine kinase